MNTLVVYDTLFGDTMEVAREVADILAGHGRTRLLRVDNATNEDVRDSGLLVVGSPTQGGHPTEKMRAFLDGLPDLSGMQAAAFDTRLSDRGHGPALNLLIRHVGYAADRMARILQDKGATLITEPGGFIVEHRSGPLKDGELDHANMWVTDMFQLA